MTEYDFADAIKKIQLAATVPAALMDSGADEAQQRELLIGVEDEVQDQLARIIAYVAVFRPEVLGAINPKIGEPV